MENECFFFWEGKKSRIVSENISVLQDGLDEDSFENYKSGLLAKLLEKDPSLTYESNRFWNQIVDKRY